MHKVENGLVKLLFLSQVDDGQATVALLDQFKPLLKKYSRKLQNEEMEDAYADLRMEFIKAMKKINYESFSEQSEAAIIAYIVKIVHNSFLKLAKQQNVIKSIPLSATTPGQQVMLDKLTSKDDSYDNLFLIDIQNILTPREYMVIDNCYIQGYSIAEIAKEMDLSRQATNRIKKTLFKSWNSNF